MQYFMQNKSETGREVLHCVAILGGTLFYAAGMNLFVVPAGLYTGGIMGLAQLLRTLLIHLTGWTPKIDIAGFADSVETARSHCCTKDTVGCHRHYHLFNDHSAYRYSFR